MLGVLEVPPPLAMSPAQSRQWSRGRTAQCSVHAAGSAPEPTDFSLPSLALPPVKLPPLCGRAANARADAAEAGQTQASAVGAVPCPPESFDTVVESCPLGGETLAARQAQWVWSSEAHGAVPRVPALLGVPGSTQRERNR
jgi:hypothetical protein